MAKHDYTEPTLTVKTAIDTYVEDDMTELYQSKSDLEGRATVLESEMDAVELRATDLESRATAVEGRATTLESEMDAVELRATDLESRATAVEGRATTLESEMDAVEGRATTLETEMDAVELRATNLESRADASEGTNNVITELTGLTTALSIPQGGTGQKTAQNAINALTEVSVAEEEDVLTVFNGNAVLRPLASISNRAKVTRQCILTSPDLITTPDTVGTAATKAGDLSNQYHDLGLDMLTGSKGGMVLQKDKGTAFGTVLQSSILPNVRDFLATNLVDNVGSATLRAQQFTAEGIQLGETATLLGNANLYAFATTHEKWMPDGSYWQYNPVSGFAMCVFTGISAAWNLLHPMGKKPLMFVIKGMESAGSDASWTVGRRDSDNFMYMNKTDAETFNESWFPEPATDQYIPLGVSYRVSEDGKKMFLFGWFGDDLSDLYPGMAGMRGNTASIIIPANSGEVVIETGINDIQSYIWRGVDVVADWQVRNKAAGFDKYTFLNTTTAEASAVNNVVGSTISFTNRSYDQFLLVIGGDATAPSTRIKHGANIVRKVGTAAAGHRVDLGHDFVSGNNGGMVFGTDVISSIRNNQIHDTIRGPGVLINTSSDTASVVNLNALEAFTSTGIQVGAHVGINSTQTNQYTAFGTTEKVTTSDGLIWSINRKTGFAMVKYTGDAVVGRTLKTPFGDGKVPLMLWVKNLTILKNWSVYSHFLSLHDYLVLNTDGSVFNNDNVFSSLPTDEEIILGGNGTVNAVGDEYILYGWFGTDISDAQDGSLYGVEGATAFWAYPGGSVEQITATKLINPYASLAKATDSAGDWFWFVHGNANKLYRLSATTNETDNPTGDGNNDWDGDEYTFAGSVSARIYAGFGSGIESGIDDQVILPASVDDRFIGTIANGFNSTGGNADIMVAHETQRALTVTGTPGQKFITIDANGILGYEAVRPEYLRDFVPYAKGNFVFGIDQMKMYDTSGAANPKLFLGECQLDPDGNVFDLITYASEDSWEIDWFTWLALTAFLFDNKFGHTQLTVNIQGLRSDGQIVENYYWQNTGATNLGAVAFFAKEFIKISTGDTPVSSTEQLKAIIRRTF